MRSVYSKDSAAFPKGFTLIELIIVIILASLIFGLSIPFFAGSLPSARLHATAAEISAAIRHMKALAQNRGVDQILIFDLDARVYGIEGVKMKAIPAGISIRVEDVDLGEIRSGKYPVRFHATGQVDLARLVLWYKNKGLIIDVDPIVGAVTVRQ